MRRSNIHSTLTQPVQERDQGMGHQRRAPSWHVHQEGCSGSKRRWWRERGEVKQTAKGRRRRDSPLTCITRSSASLFLRTRLFDTNQFFSFPSPFTRSVVDAAPSRPSKQSDVRREKYGQIEGRESFYVNYLIYIHEIIE